MIKTEYIVGDKVRVKSLGHNIYTVVRVEYTARNPYLLNTEGGFWYHADDLKPVLQEEPAPVESQPVQPLTDLHAKIAALEAENARLEQEVTFWRKKAEYEVIFADSLANQALAHLEAQRTDSLIDALQKLMKPASTEAPATSEDES